MASQPLSPLPVIAAGLSGGRVLGSLDGQAGLTLSPPSSTSRGFMSAKLQGTLLPESGCLPPPLVIKSCSLTLIKVDIVLPLLLVPRAVVPRALQDVSPIPDVMPDGHLFQATVRIPDSPPSLPDPAWCRAHLGGLLVDLWGTVPRVGVGDYSGG